MPTRREPARKRPPAMGRLEREPPATRFRWPPRLAALLGRIPDEDLARRAKLTRQSVLAERRRRRIPASRYQRPVVQWTPEMIALLGQDTDTAVAAELGLGPHSVSRKRRILGIEPHTPSWGGQHGYRWTERAIALLGTASDPTIARRLHISKSQVQYERHLRAIPPFQPGPSPVDWTKERIELLGRLTDREVARRLGVTQHTVAAKRQELRISPRFAKGSTIKRNARLRHLLRLPTREVVQGGKISPVMVWKLRKEYGIPSPGGPRKPKRWTPGALAKLGKESDAAIAADLGAHPATVLRKRKSLGIDLPGTRRRWSAEERALLGTMPDAELARRIGRSEAAVQLQRSRQGRRQAAKQGLPLKEKRLWPERELALLGTMPDAELARRIGRSKNAVQIRRALEGLPPMEDRRRPRRKRGHRAPR